MTDAFDQAVRALAAAGVPAELEQRVRPAWWLRRFVGSTGTGSGLPTPLVGYGVAAVRRSQRVAPIAPPSTTWRYRTCTAPPEP